MASELDATLASADVVVFSYGGVPVLPQSDARLRRAGRQVPRGGLR